MPKVLIREYDNSTTGIPASDNFAVVVPGYFGTPGTYIENGETKQYDATDILIDYDVYELKSQKDFENYIGKKAYLPAAAKAPVLQEVNTADNANEYSKFLTALEQDDFIKYPGCIYLAEEITNSTDPKYGKSGYLHTTISYYLKKEQDLVIGGVPQFEEDGETPKKEWVDDTAAGLKTVTIKLTPVELPSEVAWEETMDPESDKQLLKSKLATYCIINPGDEGSDAIQAEHIGNQIAYELLGLGYTVLFKKMSSVWTKDKDGNNIEVANNDVLNTAEFWEPLKDKSVFNFRYVMTGGYYAASAMNQICALADFRNDTILEEAETYGTLSGRGDCIALCDIDENIRDDKGNHAISSGLTMKTLIENIGYAAKQITSNQYSAIFGPKVTYVMSKDAVEAFGGNKTFPASFHYLACARRTFDRYNEWYAVAGYNRGISNYSIETTSVKLGEIAINTLAPRIANAYTTKSVNLILHERGNYYLWGNRTGYALDNKGIVFRHFLNIRQLCCSIKKQLYTACRQFTFDPNSDLLWINFINAIKPTLEAMKADQGIKGYTITRTANDKKALLTARIRIVPIEAVEDFDISIYLEDSLTGIVVNASEAQA